MNERKKKIDIDKFFNLPIKDQEKILSEVADEANQDQRDLVKRYDKQFGEVNPC